MIDGSISGLAPGLHGIHVHIFGDFSQGLTSAGGIFNPFARNHGGPNDEERMAGDLGNLEVAEDGSCSVHIEDRHVKLIGPHSIIGRSIVVFGGEDDFGKGGHALLLREEVLDGVAHVGARVVHEELGDLAQRVALLPRVE